MMVSGKRFIGLWGDPRLAPRIASGQTTLSGAWLQPCPRTSGRPSKTLRSRSVRRFPPDRSGRKVWAVLLFACAVLPAASASITRWDPLPKPLGNANFRGYAQVERELGSWRLPDGTEIPLHLVLQSDPSVEPGPLGPGWHLPFFRSDFVRVKDYEALWEMPNGRRKFFPRDRLAEEPDGDALRFRSREGDWTALWEKDRRGIEATVTSTDDPAWWFRYEDGRLHSFRMGEESPEYRVDWLGGSNFPRAIRPANRRQGPVEILYAGRTPESIRVGEREWELEMDEGDWTAPDGRSDYLAYRVRFLAALTGPDGTTERFGYEKGDLKERTVGVPGAAKAARTVRVPVNRLAVRDGEGNERGFLAWEARSGFLVEDSGAAYAVASEGRDPEQPGYAEARRRGDIAPEAVRIERRPEEGPPQLWSYDYGSGRRERTDPSTGEIFRETHIVSPGPAYGKLRKREKKTPEGKWELVEHRAYDPEGRLLSIVSGNGDRRRFEWISKDRWVKRIEYDEFSIVQSEVVYDSYGALSSSFSRNFNLKTINEELRLLESKRMPPVEFFIQAKSSLNTGMRYFSSSGKVTVFINKNK